MGENGANAPFSGGGNEIRGLHVLPAAASGPVIDTLNMFASYYQDGATSVNPPVFTTLRQPPLGKGAFISLYSPWSRSKWPGKILTGTDYINEVLRIPPNTYLTNLGIAEVS